MGFIMDDKNFINDNIYKFEKRLESQYTIFLEKNPTFVTYFHINNANSIADSGLMNVERIIGPDSPIRFQQINDFPIYGLEQIQLNLSDDEEGLTGNFDGDAIILPNTIKPLPNDYFTISYLGNQYTFMVSEISYDTIKSNNFYRINYFLKSADGTEDIKLIKKQVIGEYNCIFKNIGTDDKCIIESDACEKIVEIEKIYHNLVERYITLFYSKKYNSLLFDDNNTYIYDKFLSHFVNSNNLLNEKNDYNTIVLNNEDYGTHFLAQYENSIFDVIECKAKERLKYIRCSKSPITYQQSVFNYYNKLSNVKSIYFFDLSDERYLPDKLVDNILTNENTESNTIEDMIIRYFNNDNLSIYNINIDELRLYRIRYSLLNFREIPILLYILRDIIKNFLRI